MAEGMIAHAMAPAHHFPDQAGILFHLAAQDKESGVGLILGQQIQDLLGVNRGGAVIEGEGNRIFVRRPPADDRNWS